MKDVIFLIGKIQNVHACFNPICNACAETAKSDEKGYDEGNYRVGKCPRGECKKDYNMPSSVVSDKKSFNPFFLPRKRKKICQTY